MIEAQLYKKQKQQQVQCRLCAHFCRLRPGRLGICRVRKNIAGFLYSLNYDKLAAMNLDPIEKKPLHHFLPGSTSFSIAAMGCNFSCSFCQNYSLSAVEQEAEIMGQAIAPQMIVERALRAHAASISYTYSEPTVFFELMYETARLAQDSGLKNVMVSNGYMSPDALEMMAPYLDAANIDLKSFSDDFYRRQCAARLQPVIETIRAMRRKGIWVEVTTLLIPGLNSTEDEIRQIIGFIRETDRNMPWHVSRFFPHHRLLDAPATSEESIFQALQMASAMGLTYLYAGNVTSGVWSDTRCSNCRERLIRRDGYHVTIGDLAKGVCGRCGTPLPGVWV